MHRVNTVIIDNGRVYQIATMSRWTDPLTDPELLETIRSFRFLSQGSKRSARPSAPEPAFRTPRWIGRITGWVIVGIVVVFALSRNDSVEIGERDRPGRSSRRPADWLSAPRNPPNGASSRGNNGLRRDAENSGRDARAPQSN
jgi:hypothetical protein